jgi:CheY-like chemotaxis protein
MNTKKVLIIDDESLIREVLKICLHDLAGWDVLEAESGKEGLAIAASEHPDAIVLDICMPQMDGNMVLQRLHDNPLTEVIPVVLLTATPDRVTGQPADQLGVVKMIPKPFDTFRLSEQIATACGWN